MATRSMIGKLNDNGTVTAIYCHWDGYLEHNGSILAENYTNPNRVDQLMELGDLSVLGQYIGEKHDFDNRTLGYCSAYGRDRGEKDTAAKTYSLSEYNATKMGDKRGVDYVYLFDGKEWLYETYGYGWKQVSADLKQVKQASL